jgi:hypothetical protein
MNATKALLILAFISITACTITHTEHVLKMSETNNRYLEFRGKPVILMGSTEHYGALMNLDFDYVKYFDELQRSGLNLTRTFTGIYVEPEGAFNIEKNTLAPTAGRLITPFARSTEPGYANGGNKFDLSQWDEAYFERLRDFVEQADKRDIIVEITLFSSNYEDAQWQVNPQNPQNNINNLPEVPFNEVQTLLHQEYLQFQENMLKKIVEELNPYKNVYFEICNEPYADQIPQDWHLHMARLVRETENSLPNKHIVSWNYENNGGRIDQLPSYYSMVNFHYAEPRAVTENYHLNVPIGDNETGFKGNADWPYRVEAWAFMLAGGALFNHLDYSFAVGHESGDFAYPRSQPGGGNAGLREQFGFLRKFLEGMDFLQMKANPSFVISASDPTIQTQVFANDSTYNVYLYKRWSLPNENISIRFTGDFKAPATGEYTFTTVSDDGIRMWVDNTLIIDNWTDHAAVVDVGKIQLETGKKVPVKIEYYNGLYGGSVKVSWSNATTSETILKDTHVSIPGTNTSGFKAEYFTGRNFEQFEREDTLAFINHEILDFKIADPGYTGLSATLIVDLPTGTYTAAWMDPRNGNILSTHSLDHPGGETTFDSQIFDYDALLVIEAY